MATIRVKFQPSSVDGREGHIYYQITHEKKTCRIRSDWRVRPSEWGGTRKTVVIRHDSVRRDYLRSVGYHVRCDVECLNLIISRFDQDFLPYSASDVADEFRRRTSEATLFRFMGSLIAGLRDEGRLRTAETYQSALNTFRRFLCEGKCPERIPSSGDIMLDRLTQEVVEAYEAWLRRCGNVANTRSFYTRILRAVYNKAVRRGLTIDRKPFRNVYTGVDRTRKRALRIEELRRIRQLDLSSDPRLDYARDIFMLSFYLRGMSFIDMCYLRKGDLCNGRLVYRRRKTGQELVIRWTREMQAIVDKYPGGDSDKLLPILRRQSSNDYYAYRNASYRINCQLKLLAARAGIEGNLTLYVARHSWASAAKAKGVPLQVISEGMGHESETTTLIYLASMDATVIDKANSLVIAL